MAEAFSADTGGRSLEDAEAVIEAGHPPMANKVALIDFDGTIAPFGYLFDFPEPKEGAIEALKALQDAGYRVIIFTSRLSPMWLESVGQTMMQHIQYITDYLGRYGFTADGLTAQKIPAEFMIDDKAYRFNDNWPDLTRQLLG